MNETDAGPRTVTIERDYAAPPEAVFEAWVDPDQIAQWWAPDGMEVPRESVTVEPEVGGRYELQMVGADSGDGPWLRSEIIEIDPPRLLVFKTGAMPEHGVGETTTRVEIRAEGNGSRCTVEEGPYPDSFADRAGMGRKMTLEKLAKLLEG
jgi:uncharacterized protein YndB with AHSA1/START domain